MKQETDTYFIILQIEKKKLLEYKSTIQENLQTEQFTKGLVYDFGQKIEIVSTHSSVFWGKIGHEIYFCDIIDRKKTFETIKINLRKNRKIRTFPKAFVHDVAQKLERFQIVIRAKRHFKCCLFTCVACRTVASFFL